MRMHSVKNTAINNRWALKNLRHGFKAERNKTEVPLEVLLSNDDPTVLCDTLCLYVKVTKKTDGSWIADGWCCSFNNCTSD